MELKDAEIIDKADLRNSTVYLLENNIIKIRVGEYSILEVSDIDEIQDAKLSLIQNQRHTVMFVTPRYGSITPEAREYSASEEVNKNAIAKAIVLNGLAMRIITNFFITVNKPPVIHKVFENEKEALKWLRTMS